MSAKGRGLPTIEGRRTSAPQSQAASPGVVNPDQFAREMIAGRRRALSRSHRLLCLALNEDAAGCQVLSVRSQPDGMLRPWRPLRSLLAVQFGVADTDTDSAKLARRKVDEGLEPWFEERGERQAQLLGQLSGLAATQSDKLAQSLLQRLDAPWPTWGCAGDDERGAAQIDRRSGRNRASPDDQHALDLPAGAGRVG